MTDTMIPQGIPAGQPLVMFRQALFQSQLRQWWARLTLRCSCLEELDEMLACRSVDASRYAGIRTVRISRIRGTQGKSDEFDAGFHPTQERSRSRWMGVAMEKLRGHDLPPVELIQVGDTYFVRDGHHRISVSRAMGQDFVDAEVTVMELSPWACAG